MKNEMNTMSRVVFGSRWLQAPLYLGLIAVLAIYVYEFGASLMNLVRHATSLSETQIMLHALDLIDMVMIANLLIMVIVGGFETFVSRLNLSGHRDQPEWLDEFNAGTMKVKLAIALISISSIHLLRTFIEPELQKTGTIMWQVVIHVTLVVSAIALAYTNNILTSHRSK